LALTAASGCAGDPSPAPSTVEAVALGVGPVPRVYLYENHSSALIAWRRAGVMNRVLVHLDGHLDLDWLPDETVARIAASHADELSDLESHPYSLDNDTYARFGNPNFLYAAARLGIIRRVIWVVPDATLDESSSFARLARETIFNRIQMVTFDEALELRRTEMRIEGNLLGVPVTICRLSDLPPLEEPVLLDIDLDYFTTRSAVTGWITERPWTTPNAVLEQLGERGLQTDLVTISLSTIGGHVAPANRWMGDALQQRLRSSATGPDPAAQAVFEAEESERAGDVDAASKSYTRHTELVPHDASGWLLLSRALEKAGREDESTAAWSRAVELDPLLEHE
ncbi:MAG: hypothetical protein R3344_15985, partial [Acidobacteriota bacterium]|nr:hypothetical protein [Acidobacteriota bacterium]